MHISQRKLNRRRLRKLNKINVSLREKGKKIISRLYPQDWPTNDIRSPEMDSLTNRLDLRLLSSGMLGSMGGLMLATQIEMLLPSLASYLPILNDASVQVKVMISCCVTAYFLGGFALTKLSYHRNGFWNMCSELNELRDLREQHKKNQITIDSLIEKFARK